MLPAMQSHTDQVIWSHLTAIEQNFPADKVLVQTCTSCSNFYFHSLDGSADSMLFLITLDDQEILAWNSFMHDNANMKKYRRAKCSR